MIKARTAIYLLQKNYRHFFKEDYFQNACMKRKKCYIASKVNETCKKYLLNGSKTFCKIYLYVKTKFLKLHE
jgi:hypothetical protein